MSIQKKVAHLCDFICHQTLTPSMATVTQEQVALIVIAVGANKEEDVGELSTPQLLNQTGHLLSMVSLFGGGPSIKFKFKKEEVIGAKIGTE